MNRFDDLLPEEKIPQYEELITILEHAYRPPVSLSSTEEDQVIERVRGRLLQIGLEDSPLEEKSESQAGVLDSQPHIAVFPSRKPQRNPRRLRFIALLAATLTIAALFITPLLLMRFSLNSQTGGTNSYPTLTLSTNAASPGSTVHVRLHHFSPSARVVLTHDIQEPITVNGSSSITTDAQGNSSFPMVIDAPWGPGFHLIVAEDVNSRSTASANLQITGEGITQPAHLLINTTPLTMGSDFVGTNTIRSLSLENSGNGSISWTASSDASWLLVAPSQGIFSQHQVISVAAQRLGLKAGDYHGNLTISSNVSPAQHIEVDMSVRPLPPNAGPVLAVTPALLSYSASDDQQNTSSQTLTISNPGSQPLQWSLTPVQGLSCNWLGVSPSTGTVPPGASQLLTVGVHSQCLTPGVYTGTLTFTASGAIDSSQVVNVAVVVQPHCGLVTSTGFLAFTLVAGQATRANQSFSLNATASCAGTSTPWSYSSTEPWLSVTPGSGQLQGTASSVITASVNAAGLAPSKIPYSANLSFFFGQGSLTVVVKLTVQAAPPTAPILSASPLSLSFTNIEGQADPTGQVVTITNTGHSTLNWHVTATPITLFLWLAASPAGGAIAPGQSGQLTVKVNTSQLTPGNYVGQVTLVGMDAHGNTAPGSPQTVVINLTIQPPCTLLAPSSSALSFSAVQGATANPTPQTVLFTVWGGCAWPLSWQTSVAPVASWLTQSASSGTIGGAGQSGSLVVTPSSSGLVAGTYSTTVTIAASDANGVMVSGGTQSFTVVFSVLPPCVFSAPTPTSLTFTLAQGQSSASAQPVGISETGTCGRPVSWQATPTKSWLSLTPTSGGDPGSGSSFGVNASATTLAPGTYKGKITLSASDSTGAGLGNAHAVVVTLTVTGFSLSGTVLACPVQNCASPLQLAGATVTLMNGNNMVATTVADASGTYSFSNLPLGSYTISAAGYDSSTIHYIGSLPLTLTGNAANTTINVLPG